MMRLRHLLAAVALPAVAHAQLNSVPFDIRVPVPPTPVSVSGRTALVYELHVTNVAARERAITGLEISADDGGASLLSRSGPDLKGAARLLGGAPGSDGTVLAAGRQTVLYIWIDLPTGAAPPRQLQHHLIVTPPDSQTATRRDTLRNFTIAVGTHAPAVIAPPFAGGPWLAANGPSNTSGHRRTIVPIDGRGRIAQRFATDWLKLGPDGNAFHGDSTRNANWYGYGTTVVAVADGIVTEVKDGIIENTPLSPTMAVPITLETVGGNHVNLDIGGGNVAFYAHLQPGSIRVKLGQRVKRGDPIGLLGNSGNSTAPHLHFHVTDGSSPLGSEGLPFVFDGYQQLDVIVGSIGESVGPWKAPASPPQALRRALPPENAVVRFP